MGERRIFGLKLPGLLPEGEYSILGQSGDVDRINPNIFPQESGKPTMKDKVLEAIDSLCAEGRETNYTNIAGKMEQLHPTRWWQRIGEGPFYRALYRLERDGNIEHSFVPNSEQAIESGSALVRPVFTRVEQPKQPLPEH